MKRIIALILVVLLFISLIGLLFIFSSKDEKNTDHNNINELWSSTIMLYLKNDLWQKEEAYDAGHFLMVPMHAAFKVNKKEWLMQFDEHFERFIDSGANMIKTEDARLTYLHYYFLLSRYIVLSAENEHGENQRLDIIANFLYDEINKIWLEAPAWQWDSEPFNGGMRERIMWKLKNTNTTQSYYRAIIDEEMFTFCIAADLKKYYSYKKERYNLLDDISKVAFHVFESESNFDNKGHWLFQKGVWADHQDYLYSGYTKQANIKNQPKQVYNIAEDSSHFHRFPLWITVLRDSFSKDSVEYSYYQKALLGLEKQLFDFVLTYSGKYNGYLLTNFMDGNNGVYRWDYLTNEENGYGPFELSGTFTIGWWTFLNTNRIKQVYLDISNTFPLNEELVEIYTGPNTSRARNPLTALPDCYSNGFIELITKLASKL